MVFRFSHHRGSSEFFVELQSDCDREKIAGGLSSLDSTFKIPHYEDISAMLAEKISRSKIQIFSPLSLLIFRADFIAVILLLAILVFKKISVLRSLGIVLKQIDSNYLST